MGVARIWVFPIIRLVVFAIIALALVKLAFFTGATDQASTPDVPYAQITQPEVQATIGTIRNDVKLDGLVSPKPAVPAAATLTGEVTGVSAHVGQTVKKGQPLLVLTAEVPIDPPIVDKDPDDDKVPPTTTTKTAVVLAPAAGVLSTFTALVGQSFAVGDPVGQVAPPTFVVSGSLAPDQLYRLVDQPTEATVTIPGGPAPFTCGHLRIVTPLAGATADAGAGAGGAGTSTGTTLTCTVPKKIEVFAGLAAKITVAGGLAKDVLTVPTTAVEGAAGSGNVYTLDGDGNPQPTPVVIGLNDGKNVEIVSGIAKGDSVLQFVPGAEAVCDDNGVCGGQG